MSLRSSLAAVAPTAAEVSASRPGDDIVATSDAVMDRGFTVPGAPDSVWPWIVQLGKDRAGWYLPHRVERLLPRGRRAARHLDPRWQSLALGDVVPDWGGAEATFEVVLISAPTTLVYRSQRGRVQLSWAILLSEAAAAASPGPRTRVHLRLRLGPLRRPWLADTVGDRFDLLTIAALAAGLGERLR
ncbi:MAG: hypothetical protein LH468_00925 [Nocardioides sp.]|nr:hypothetical protein [Nocardioides sp.]